jgi:V/A-type H+-transporting ATPase subunit E
MDLYNYLKSNNLTDLDRDSFFKKYSNPQEGQKIFNYLKSTGNTDLDFNSFNNKYLSNKKTSQQQLAPSPKSTPITPENTQTPKKEIGAWDKITNFFTGPDEEEKPTENLVKGFDDFIVDVKNIISEKTKNFTSPEVFEKTKPKDEFITKTEKVKNNYKSQFKDVFNKIDSELNNLHNISKDNTTYSISEAINFPENNFQKLEETINTVPDNNPFKQKYKSYLKELRTLNNNKNLDLNTLKSNKNFIDIEKSTNLEPNIINKAFNIIQEKIKNISDKNTFVEIINENLKNFPETVKESFFETKGKSSSKVGVLDIAGQLITTLPRTYAESIKNSWGLFKEKDKKLSDLKREEKFLKKYKFYAETYGFDLSKYLSNLPENERLSAEAALDIDIDNKFKSARKFKNQVDKTTTFDLLSQVQGKEEIPFEIKGYTADKNLNNGYDQIAINAKTRANALNTVYKDNLRKYIIENNLQDIFNVDTEDFDNLVDYYDEIKSNSVALNVKYNNINAAAKFEKLKESPDFQKIVENWNNFNTVNTERGKIKLQSFLENSKKELKALEYVRTLNENQQAASDYLEQQANKQGFFSKAKYDFYKAQLKEGGYFFKEIGKQFVANAASKVSGDDYWRQTEFSSELFKDINQPTDDNILSPLSDNKFIKLVTPTNNDYQIAVDNKGNFLGVRYDKFSIPVKGPIAEQIEEYYYKNQDKLLQTAKPITDYDGGYAASYGQLASLAGSEIIEEGPSILLELGAQYATTKSVQGALALTALSRFRKLATWADKLGKSEKFLKNYNKITGTGIGFSTNYLEIEHAVKKEYLEQGLDPSTTNLVIGAGIPSIMAQYTPGMEKLARQLGSDLAVKNFKKEINDVLINDIPKILPSIKQGVNGIADKNLRDFLFKKELRGYALNRLFQKSVNVLKPFVKEGLQESIEETITEPLAQLAANNMNAILEGNDTYNKQSLQDLGFLDPETAIISALTGGAISSGLNKISNFINSKANGTNSIDALRAAVNNPVKFKSLLSSFIDDSNGTGKNLTTAQYEEIVANFDAIQNNYNNTKQQYNLNSDITNQTDFENPILQSILAAQKISTTALEGINGAKTLDNLILSNSVNDIQQQDFSKSLSENLGIPDRNNNLTIEPFINENGLFDMSKYAQVTGQNTLTDEAALLVKKYNNAQSEKLNLNNTLNLFNENFASIQNNYLKNYQSIIEKNPDLTSPDLQFFNDIIKNKLYNQELNNQRIAQIETELSQFETVEKDKKLTEELNTLKTNNKELQKEINNITDTYKKGYLETQNNISILEDEYLDISSKVNAVLKQYEESDKEIPQEIEDSLNDLLIEKSKKLNKLLSEYNKANKKYNNGITANTIKSNILEKKTQGKNISNVVTKKDFSNDLKDELRKDKEFIKKIKRHKFLNNKFKNNSLTREEFKEFTKYNSKFVETKVKKELLPYLLPLTKPELELRLADNTELVKALFNNLIDLGYINFNRVGNNITPDLLLSKVLDAIQELSYNVNLVKENKLNEIVLFSKQNGAALVYQYSQLLETKDKTTTEKESEEVTPGGEIIEEEAPIAKPYTPVVVKGMTPKQKEVIELIEKNSIKRSELNDEDITNTQYKILDKLYQRVTTVDSEPFEESKWLTAGANVGNFLDGLGRIIMGNNNITKNNKEEIFDTLLQIAENKGVQLSIDKKRYDRLFDYILLMRDSLLSKGYIILTDERVVYHIYDGINFTGLNPLIMEDGSIGVAGTMDIIAIDPQGKIDIIDLKSISDNTGKASINSKKNEKEKWAKQLGFYKTILEKIEGISVRELKIIQSIVTYNLDNTGNTITNLVFNANSIKSINLPYNIKEIINRYLSIPNFVFNTDVTNNPTFADGLQVEEEGNTTQNIPDGFFTELEEDKSQSAVIPDDALDFGNFLIQATEIENFEPINDTPNLETGEGFEYDPNDYPFIESEPIITEESLIPQEQTFVTDARAEIERRRQEELDNIFQPIPIEVYDENGNLVQTTDKAIDINKKYDEELVALESQPPAEFEGKPVLDPVTQLITGEADKNNFQTSKKEFEDEANSNIYQLGEYVYVKYTVKTDPTTNENIYGVEIFNNWELNKPFKNKEFTEKELKDTFKKLGYFFSTKITSNSVYLLLDSEKQAIKQSFQSLNVIPNISTPISTKINSVNYQDLIGMDAEIILLDDPTYNNSLKTEEDFRNKSSLGVVVNGELVALIPSLTNKQKDALIRTQLTVTKENGVFNVEPFKVKIDAVKDNSMLFTNTTMPIINFMASLPGFNTTLAYVGVENKTKKLFNPFEKDKDKQGLNIPASDLTVGGVYMLLEKSGQKPIIIPLNTPKLKDYIGTIKPEQLANLKTFLSQNLTFNSKKNIKDNYVDFLNQLNDLVTSNPNSGVLKNLYNAIPKTINDTPTTSSQILKIAKLKNNFNLDTLFDYLLDTLVTLNEVTKQFYTIDVNPQNLYADNSVVISYNNSNQTVVQVIENKASSNMTKNYNPTYFC